jgi:molybdopterin adenylyltransferase
MPTKRPSAAKPRRTPHTTFTAAVLTISDSCSHRKRKDASGPAVATALKKSGFRIVTTRIVPDDQIQIQNTLLDLALQARFIATTGGTGIAPRDVTPEATRAICDRLLEGIAETMRREGSKKNHFAALSRGICGVRGKTLILNLPGSPKGAVESLAAVIRLIPHVLDLLEGKTEHE